MLNILLLDTKTLKELYNNIGDELKCRERVNITLTMETTNNILIKGPNIGNKFEEIKFIFNPSGKCDFVYWSLDDIMFYFENVKDVVNIINDRDIILKQICDLFIDKFLT